MDTYELLDSGNGKKWERFGPYVLCRPCPQAVWMPSKNIIPDAVFSRDEGARWSKKGSLPDQWEISLHGVKMKISLTDFGHLGVFPEHASMWSWMQSKLSSQDKVLNLFAYSGGATLAAAQAGAQVCHLDASKGMVDWARENAGLNQLQRAPIRWIVDDVTKFLKREERRDSRYDAIILDPPTFGRGGKGEIFKIEEEICNLLTLCKNLLSKNPKFILFSCHTPGFTPIVLDQLLFQIFGKRSEHGEMQISSKDSFCIPSGSFARISF